MVLDTLIERTLSTCHVIVYSCHYYNQELITYKEESTVLPYQNTLHYNHYATLKGVNNPRDL